MTRPRSVISGISPAALSASGPLAMRHRVHRNSTVVGRNGGSATNTSPTATATACRVIAEIVFDRYRAGKGTGQQNASVDAPFRGRIPQRNPAAWRALREVLVREVPVHELPERLDELRRARCDSRCSRRAPTRRASGCTVLPAANGVSAFAVVSIASEPSAFLTSQAQPEPNWPSGCLGELVLEVGEAAERLVDRAGDRAGRVTAGLGREAVPEERVVPHLRGVVEELLLATPGRPTP